MNTTKLTTIEHALEVKIKDYGERFNQKRIPKPKRCQLCRQAGRLRWHSCYKRKLITMTRIYTLTIRRLFCASCGTSFACLPDFVEKFRHYAKAVIYFALKLLKTLSYNNVAGLFTASADCPFTPLTLYLWRRKFAQA